MLMLLINHYYCYDYYYYLLLLLLLLLLCACNALGNEESEALLGVDAFSGCDLIGRFIEFSKTTCFDTPLKSNSIVHKGFASLGNNDDGLKKWIIDGLTKFVLDFLSIKKTIKYVFIFEISLRFWKAIT